MPPLSFKTKRLIVRPLELSDFKVWKDGFESLLKKQSEFDDPFILKSDCIPKNFKNLVQQFNKSAKNGVIYQLFAFEKGSGKIIGSGQYSLIQRYESQRAYLGYNILNNHWRQGFGLEFNDALIDHAFKKVKLHRLEAEILPKNIPSIKLSKKIGMKSEGIRKKCLYINGSWQDHKVFAITAEDRVIEGMRPNKTLL